MNKKCVEGEMVGFAENMESAVRTMSSMLNRFNHATVFVGVGKDGIPLGRINGESDINRMDLCIREKLNRLPKYSLSMGS